MPRERKCNACGDWHVHVDKHCGRPHSITRHETCWRCDGKGNQRIEDQHNRVQCSQCAGAGHTVKRGLFGKSRRTCYSCAGQGTVPTVMYSTTRRCSHCDGKGIYTFTTWFEGTYAGHDY